MPNIKSAMKRVKVNSKKNSENRAVKSEINTTIRKFKTAVQQKNVEEATKLLSCVASVLGSASSKKVIHKNTASRKLSRLSQLLETIK